MTDACPKEDLLLRFAHGKLSFVDADVVELHLDGCQDCRTLAATAASGEPPSIAAPHRIGRYELRGLLGAGGMGVVHDAWDPQLQRAVAVKILRPGGSGNPGEARERLIREAQAMARLAHPNILAVHDLGAEGDQVFLALEKVEGQTLASWLSATPRTVRQILPLFLAAGRGLSEAHRQGITHRDFKPENVLLGGDLRPRVADFGLASAAPVAATGSEIRLDRPFTLDGALLGTPAYMAPEQLLDRTSDPRSDQFSFCVALWEALEGTRPFAATSMAQLREQLSTCALPPSRRIRRKLRAVLARGLSRDPALRFRSMDELLAALEATLSRRRLWAAFAIGGVVVLGATGWVMSQPRPPPAHSHVQGAPFRLTVGGTQPLDLQGIQRIALADGALVEVKSSAGGTELRGKAPGTTTLEVWTADGVRHSYRVVIAP